MKTVAFFVVMIMPIAIFASTISAKPTTNPKYADFQYITNVDSTQNSRSDQFVLVERMKADKDTLTFATTKPEALHLFRLKLRKA